MITKNAILDRFYTLRFIIAIFSQNIDFFKIKLNANLLKMFIFSKLFARFNVIPTKTPMGFNFTLFKFG